MTRRSTKRPQFGQPMSLEEWANLPEDMPGELVEGKLVEEEVTDPFHDEVVLWLAGELRRWVLPLGGFVLGSTVKFVTRPKGRPKGRMADLAVCFPGGAVPPLKGLVREPPDIMIEIISEGAQNTRRDRVVKKREYARFGVRFYWLIEPFEHTLEILELGVAKLYEHILKVSTGIVDVPGCPGLRLDLDALWAQGVRFKPTAPAPRSNKAAARPTKVTRK